MFKLFINPSDYAKDNLFRYEDLCSEDHYRANMNRIMPRIKVAAAKQTFQHMLKFECDVYVFSEDELKEFVKNIRK